MPSVRRLSRIVLIAGGLAGCAASSIDLAPPAPDKPWTAKTTAEGEIIPGPSAADAENASHLLPANRVAAEVSTLPTVDASKVYDLADLVDLAERNNPTTRIAWNAARDAALATGIVKSAELPRIVATATAISQTSRGADQFAVGPLSSADLGTPGSASGGIAAVTFDWLLFDFGERQALAHAAEQASVIANIAFTAVHQQVIFDVSSAYYAYSAARSHSGADGQSLRNAGEVLEAAKARMTRGVGTTIEVAEAEQGVAQARLLVVQAEGAEKARYVDLVAAVGLQPTTRLRIADIGRRNLSAAMARTVDKSIENALARRPDVLQAFAAEKAAQSKLAAAEASLAPKVFLTATANYNAGGVSTSTIFPGGLQTPVANLSGERYGGAALLGVAMPVYDGGVRDAMIKQAETGVDTAATQLMFTKQAAIRQIAVASTSLTASLSAHDAAKALVASSETVYSAALDAYRSGVGDVTAASLAETRLLQARNAEADSYSAALSAAAVLALATGSLGSAPP